MQTWARRLTLVLAGALAVGGGLWLGARFPHLPDQVRDLLILLPPALAVAGAGLAAWFHRDRAVFLHAVLAGAYLLPVLYRPGGPAGNVLFDGLTLLVPLNLLLFGLLPARGLLGAAGLGRAAAIGAQAAVLAVAVAAPAAPLGRLVAQAPAAAGTALGPVALALFASGIDAQPLLSAGLMNVAVLVALLWVRWPSIELLGA